MCKKNKSWSQTLKVSDPASAKVMLTWVSFFTSDKWFPCLSRALQGPGHSHMQFMLNKHLINWALSSAWRFGISRSLAYEHVTIIKRMRMMQRKSQKALTIAFRNTGSDPWAEVVSVLSPCRVMSEQCWDAIWKRIKWKKSSFIFNFYKPRD